MKTSYEQEILTLTDGFVSQDIAMLTQSKSKEEIEQHMKQLCRVISYHNYAYYVLARPVIADVQYDHLFGLLLQLEEAYPDLRREDSPTQRFVGQVLEGFSKVRHQGQMLSLENTYSAEDIVARCERVSKVLKKQGIESWSYCVEPKYDGS